VAAVSVVTLAAMAATIAAPLAQRVAATPTLADVVVEWNTHAQTAIVTTAGQGPTVAYLHFAMVQGAVYDAVNAIEGGYQPYVGAPASADPSDSASAAAAQAAHDVLAGIFPAQAGALDTKLATTLGTLPDAGKAGGVEVGQDAAEAMLGARANDGRFSAFTVVQGTENGQWRSTFFSSGNPVVEPAPWVGNVTPFVIPSGSVFRSKGPNALTSDAYTRDYNEVKRLGSLTSTRRTADQTEAAVFWQANAAVLFNSLMRQLVGSQGLDGAEAARLFAMGDMAGADGAIQCWNDKYYYRFWRPITAIRQGSTDGNPDTVGDTEWTPLFNNSPPSPLTTPAFPEHPSGHGCVSGAVVETLKTSLGNGGRVLGVSRSSRRFRSCRISSPGSQVRSSPRRRRFHPAASGTAR
jgi:hypothetical protein